MGAKNVCRFMLSILLFSSCLQTKFYQQNMLQNSQEELIEEEIKAGDLGLPDVSEHYEAIYSEEVYKALMSLVADPAPSGEEIMQFLSINKTYLDGSKGEQYPLIHYVLECGEDALAEEIFMQYPKLVRYKAGKWNSEPLHTAAHCCSARAAWYHKITCKCKKCTCGCK
jgi:hypothetical protein